MPKVKLTLEKRGHQRFSIKIPLKFHLEKNKKILKGIEDWRRTENNAYTLDMSLGGMRIAVDHPLKVGDVLQFDIYLLDKSNAVNVYASVIRADKNSAGLKFLMIKDDEREALKDFLGKIT